jgi:hypothetical protein
MGWVKVTPRWWAFEKYALPLIEEKDKIRNRDKNRFNILFLLPGFSKPLNIL